MSETIAASGTSTPQRVRWHLSNDNGAADWCITDGVDTFDIANASQTELSFAIEGTITKAVTAALHATKLSDPDELIAEIDRTVPT